MSFVQGRNALQAYLGSGRSVDLERAKAGFSAAHRGDPAFTLASFYLAVASTELRDSKTAIEILRPLTIRKVDFLPEALLQLAYAYTKTYENPAYRDAERALDQALDEARRRSRGDLIPIIQAYKVFLFSVMAGRYQDKGERPRYGKVAIELGEQLLRDLAIRQHPAKDQILFELHNALGIAYWRKGENEPALSASQDAAWSTARKHFDDALHIRPSATRTLHNLGSLFLAEGDQFTKAKRGSEAEGHYRTSLEVYQSSLALNPLDQFPHYRVSELAAKLGDWNMAEQYFASGRLQSGEVKQRSWDKLKDAITRRDASELLNRD